MTTPDVIILVERNIYIYIYIYSFIHFTAAFIGEGFIQEQQLFYFKLWYSTMAIADPIPVSWLVNLRIIDIVTLEKLRNHLGSCLS